MPTAFIVYWILVRYRVGSLENLAKKMGETGGVRYRVGSLENSIYPKSSLVSVHCRVGGQKSIQTAF
ncbi:hypothetical protein B6D21_10165 [Gilliamella apis]|nr:hypothetical protein B6D21_10165 [Gilliamella apis]